MLLRALAAAGLSALCIGSPTAYAGSADAITRTAYVRTADLNLASPEGVSTLKSRVKGAVQRVCGPVVAFDRTARVAVNACRADAMALARPQMQARIDANRNQRLALAR